MFTLPEHLKSYRFSGPTFDHPICLEAESKYESVLVGQLFLPDGTLYDELGTLTAKIVLARVIDPKSICQERSFDSFVVVKNPLKREALYATKGYRNALVATEEWMYLASTQKGYVQAERPLRPGFIGSLRDYFEQSTQDVNWALINRY